MWLLCILWGRPHREQAEAVVDARLSPGWCAALLVWRGCGPPRGWPPGKPQEQSSPPRERVQTTREWGIQQAATSIQKVSHTQSQFLSSLPGVAQEDCKQGPCPREQIVANEGPLPGACRSHHTKAAGFVRYLVTIFSIRWDTDGRFYYPSTNCTS